MFLYVTLKTAISSSVQIILSFLKIALFEKWKVNSNVGKCITMAKILACSTLCMTPDHRKGPVQKKENILTQLTVPTK